MTSEGCLKITLVLLGILFTAVTLYIVFLLPETVFSPEDEEGSQKGPPAQRFFRNKRAIEGDDCLWVLIAKESVGTLTSPNYPDSYPRNADCQWLLTTLGPNETISIKIGNLMIEPDAECRLDYLQVFLGSNVLAPSLGPFCGIISNRIIHTNASTLLLVFNSDSDYEDKGFSIDYFIPTANGCKDLLTDDSNTLTSPGFPENYPDNADCSTLITVGEGKKIILNFHLVDLEFGDNCTFDYIQIFDGTDKNATLLGQICQQADPRRFESSSGSLLVHFHSDSTVNKNGYRAKYSSVDRRSSPIGNCQWESGENGGAVTSPNYPENYPSFANCSIWILAPEGKRISVRFEALLLEMESNCSYDYLQITEGSPAESKVVGRFCGRGTEPKSLTSNEREMKVEFRSDNFVEFLGFKMIYEFVNTKEEVVDKLGEVSESDEAEDDFTFSARPQNATLSAGSSYMLHCSTEYPNARIRWLKGDVFLAGDNPLPGLNLLTNNTLWIKNMQNHLIGRYTCVAVSPEEDITAMAYILMNGRSEEKSCGIEFRKTPKDSEFEEGEFAHLECVAATAGAQLSWEKDGQPLKQDAHIIILKNGYIFTDKVEVADAGVYTCIIRDMETGCTKTVSAVLQVSERTKIENICGRPRLGQSTKEKSRSDHAKIIGGYNAQKGAYPWQVMLWEPRRKSFCGGTLLNERWIATAAHCIQNEYNIDWDKILIKLGKHDRIEEEDQEMETTVSDPSAIVIHPDFNKNTFDNDLALIRLRNHVYFTDYILPICLGDRQLSERLLNGDGDNSKPRMGTVIGWGRLKENGGSPRFLQQIKLPIVDHQVCRNSTKLQVTRNMFCAGYSQELIGDSCQGDSGGPFMMKHEEIWYVVGIVSWGEGCGKKDKYGFYTRIPNHLSWIRSIINS